MYQSVTNVQRAEAVPLQQYIDNRGGRLRVGLRSITYTVGWYNVEAGETLSWRPAGGGAEETFNLPPGLYGFAQLQEAVQEASPDTHSVAVSQVNGLITLLVEVGWEIRLSDGLLTLLGLDDGLGGVWLDAGVYTGDRPVNFGERKELWVYLGQINTSGNVLDGAPSQLLAVVGVGRHSFGDISTVRVEVPEMKRLQDGALTELRVVIRDGAGIIIDNHNLPVHVVLDIAL